MQFKFLTDNTSNLRWESFIEFYNYCKDSEHWPLAETFRWEPIDDVEQLLTGADFPQIYIPQFKEWRRDNNTYWETAEDMPLDF